MSKVSSSGGGGDAKNTLYCSFCGKSQHEVRKLIAGPTVFICDECVELCMGVTQSAASKQLAQLREWFDDPLFVRTRDGMQPTPRAAELSGLVGSILEHAAALTSSDRVSPDAFTGRFVLSATDEVLERVLPALVRRLSVEAPRMTLVTLPVARDYSIRQLEAGQVNLLLAVNWHAPDQLLQRKLDSDPFVCVMGVLQWTVGDHERAIEYFERGLEVCGRHEEARSEEHLLLNNLGLAQASLGRNAEAIATFRRALAAVEGRYGTHHPQRGDMVTLVPTRART